MHIQTSELEALQLGITGILIMPRLTGRTICGPLLKWRGLCKPLKGWSICLPMSRD